MSIKGQILLTFEFYQKLLRSQQRASKLEAENSSLQREIEKLRAQIDKDGSGPSDVPDLMPNLPRPPPVNLIDTLADPNISGPEVLGQRVAKPPPDEPDESGPEHKKHKQKEQQQLLQQEPDDSDDEPWYYIGPP
jgi:hypothetical protein